VVGKVASGGEKFRVQGWRRRRNGGIKRTISKFYRP
jgi:hypothetical protein